MAIEHKKTHCETCQSRLLGVFCSLEERSQKELDQHKTVNEYKKGQVLFYEGNEPYAIFCVFSGHIKLYITGIDGKSQIVRLAGPGDLLGYRAFFAEEPYHATAETLEDSTICCIDKKAFHNVLGKDPSLGLNLIKKLAKELRAAEDLATSIAQKSARERMAELILMLKESFGKKSPKGHQIGIHLSREELAEMVGITQETAIRVLSDFKKEEMIEVQGRDISIIDLPALIKTANFEVST